MWVEVVKVTRRGFVGHLSNTAAGITRLEPGDRIRFRAHHIIDIWPDDGGEVGDVHEAEAA